MNPLVRIVLSLITLGISEFFFVTPLPNNARIIMGIFSLGLSELAYRKNKKLFVIGFALFAVLGFVGGKSPTQPGGGTAASSPTPTAIATEDPTTAPTDTPTQSALPTPPPSQAPSLTVSQDNAVRKGLAYLDYSAFSRKSLIDQLVYEGYSKADATFAVDYIDVDWMEQAALKAQSYLDYSPFSRQGLIDQLIYEGFTQKEAVYGVNQVGL